MESVFFQLAKIGFSLLSVAVIIACGFILFYASQYTQFNNQSRRIIQSISCIPPNLTDYQKMSQSNKEIRGYNGSSNTIKQFRDSDNSNYSLAYKAGATNQGLGSLENLEHAYHYIFTIKPESNDNKIKAYGHPINYIIQIRIPLIGVPGKTTNGGRQIKVNTPQSVDSVLENDTSENTSN